MRINNAGYYEFCRWQLKNDRDQYRSNISDTDHGDFFINQMSEFRTSMLSGDVNDICTTCFEMENHNQVSGRQRQLIKIGVDNDNFEKSLLSSEWITHFNYSNKHAGLTTSNPMDWQIDLGNYCNAGCLFCTPSSSSKLAAEWEKIGLIDKLPPNSWCNNSNNVEKFITYLCDLPNIYYLHFIGGETLITPAFKTILQRLVDSGQHSKMTIGFTTNLMVWDDTINDLLVQFKQVHLGLSIEALHPVNDYVRWPSNINVVKETLAKWVIFGKHNDWLIQLRITPTILTALHLTTIYEYAIKHQLGVESCDFLDDPDYMRVSTLPASYRNAVIVQLQQLTNTYKNTSSEKTIINTRNQSTIQLIQDVTSYINYLQNAPDESDKLPQLIEYLKMMEHSRKNSILNYLPEYEDLFRTAGY